MTILGIWATVPVHDLEQKGECAVGYQNVGIRKIRCRRKIRVVVAGVGVAADRCVFGRQVGCEVGLSSSNRPGNMRNCISRCARIN
jgi:hypothetical protein